MLDLVGSPVTRLNYPQICILSVLLLVRFLSCVSVVVMFTMDQSSREWREVGLDEPC